MATTLRKKKIGLLEEVLCVEVLYTLKWVILTQLYASKLVILISSAWDGLPNSSSSFLNAFYILKNLFLPLHKYQTWLETAVYATVT